MRSRICTLRSRSVRQELTRDGALSSNVVTHGIRTDFFRATRGGRRALRRPRDELRRHAIAQPQHLGQLVFPSRVERAIQTSGGCVLRQRMRVGQAIRGAPGFVDGVAGANTRPAVALKDSLVRHDDLLWAKSMPACRC
jgi:peptidoglycan hydrolase-like protein with peptidoglycan-binding domain